MKYPMMIYDVFLRFEDFFGKMIGDSFRRPYSCNLKMYQMYR